ncbi:lactocin 705-beta family bacteriocin [Latilactobacillus sakei]|uniref:lactocin 705-beta family bacteriocin n=1 Tax=Latilactobacillus sakei TaxID=1599 RepID=UPI001F4BFADC|nr:lactocin 705-beta family bacteriocin [Latilactobacillus sakei]UNC22128.1 ComC/BlpC family leader-containing pheromone/bacteriocin [Latilactobacillus sakei]UNC24049.1 ComC/BlpC family leader-containing pheromone/bacteriocin [Latilactobacillus sakei]
MESNKLEKFANISNKDLNKITGGGFGGGLGYIAGRVGAAYGHAQASANNHHSPING